MMIGSDLICNLRAWRQGKPNTTTLGLTGVQPGALESRKPKTSCKLDGMIELFSSVLCWGECDFTKLSFLSKAQFAIHSL